MRVDQIIRRPGPSFADRADRRAAQAMIRHGSRSFHAASLFLPARFRRDAYALYGFCRLSDDAVDLGAGDKGAVARLMARLDAIYAGAPQDCPIDRAFADMVAAHAPPRAWMDALIEGLAWDVEGRSYDTLSDLRAYAARVAGAVGVMMAHLMGVRDEARLACAADLGLAMQFTNIARDVGEDAAMGRVYLPTEWLEAAGVDRAALIADPKPSAAVRGLVARLLAEADRHYARADEGLRALPAAYRPAMWAARRLYAAIGDEVARADFDSLTRRAVTSGARKARLAFASLVAAARSAPCALAPATPETAFLIDAAPGPVLEPARAPEPAQTPVFVAMVEIIGRMERVERERNGAVRA